MLEKRDFKLKEVLMELSDVKNWKELVLHLGVPREVMNQIELGDKAVDCQKSEAISWWMGNSATASWSKLADALWKFNYPLLAVNLKLFEGMVIFSWVFITKRYINFQLRYKVKLQLHCFVCWLHSLVQS